MERRKAVALLKKHAPDTRTFRIVLRHSLAVERYALWLGRRIGKHVDLDFLSAAALLHDIGRYWHPPGPTAYKHGVKGASVLRKEGLPEKYARVCERHLGSGITKEDIRKQKLDLPSKDYLPETVEEKIIAYADKRIEGDKLAPIRQIIRRYTRELGPSYGKRMERFHREIQKLYKPHGKERT